MQNRFFSDNSLGRQKRLIEIAKRHQAKARDKARAQEARLGRLQQEYEESMRLHALQQEREVARMEKKLQHAAASYIQYMWRKQRILAGRRRKAACLLQRAWRVQLSKKKITRFPRAYRHLKHMEKLERSAKVVQRALGKHAAYRRLMQSNELARYPQVMARQWPPQLPISSTDLQLAGQTLQATKASYKNLSLQESNLTKQLESVQRRVQELKEKRDDEADKLTRFHALEAYRRAKDDTTTQQKLQEVETRMRTEIRAELEKEFEASRRAVVREKSKQQRQARDLDRMAASIHSKQRCGRLQNSKAMLFQRSSSRRRSMDGQTQKMARDELMDALQVLRTARSIDGVKAHFHAIHDALDDIQRKRSRFLEDAFATVLRQVWTFVKRLTDGADDGHDEMELTLSSLQAIEVCVEFVEPLLLILKERASSQSLQQDIDDAIREKAVLVAYLLHLLGRDSRVLLTNDSGGSHTEGKAKALRLRLADHIVACGVDLSAIFSTWRFREELGECRRMLLPSLQGRNGSDEEFNSGDDDDAYEDDDLQWITEFVVKSWALTEFEYFVKDGGQEYAFAGWSNEGIATFAYVLLVESPVTPSTQLSALYSSLSWLSTIAPFAQSLLQAEDSLLVALCHSSVCSVMRFQGLQLLHKVLARISDAALPCQCAATDSKDDQVPSFKEKYAGFRNRDWVTPLVQLITNAMVSFPEPSERSFALATLRSLLSKIEFDHRFAVLRNLILTCPYANVGAVFVDELRSNVVHVWVSSLETNSASPFASQEVGNLVHAILEQASERDLVLQADLVASCASLVRFLHIRDKDNRAGIRSDNVTSMLQRIQGRVHARIRELTPPPSFSSDDYHHHHRNHDSSSSHGHAYHTTEEFNRLLILEAVLASTLVSS
ncbi:Yap-binding/alf4/glomulin, partial [Globisporangium splendens]